VRIVLDTNVLVSALLVQGSVPDQVLGTIIAGRSRLLLDGRIMSEYREVLARPEFGFNAEHMDDILGLIELSEWILPDPLALPVPDPGDLPFLEVAVSAGADAVVTGNPRHFRLATGDLAVSILTPRQYLDRLASGR
jgi:putative PIN family toxin of toxin-antitoxin system